MSFLYTYVELLVSNFFFLFKSSDIFWKVSYTMFISWRTHDEEIFNVFQMWLVHYLFKNLSHNNQQNTHNFHQLELHTNT